MKISVITTVYKAEKDLPRLLESMMAQKSSEIEFFLIDNGSPDRCAEICKEYAKKDDRFTVYTIKDNIGYIGARNVGIKACTGDYIAFCDSDDFLEVGGYDSAIEKIKETNCDLYITGYRTIYSYGDRITKPPYATGLYEGEKVRSELRPQAFGPFKSKGILQGFAWKQILRKDIAVSNNFSFMEELKPYEDQLFNTDILGVCKSVYVDDSIIYNYIVNDESITSKLLTNFDSQGEWNRIQLLYNEKKKRVRNNDELQANINGSLEFLYSCILNMAKQSESSSSVAKKMKKMFNDNEVLSNIIENTSGDYSKVIKFIVSCLKNRQYKILVLTIRLVLKIKKI